VGRSINVMVSPLPRAKRARNPKEEEKPAGASTKPKDETLSGDPKSPGAVDNGNEASGGDESPAGPEGTLPPVA